MGHASTTRPPVVPHPVKLLASADGVKANVDAVLTPVMVTVVALAEHVPALNVADDTVVVVLEIAVTPLSEIMQFVLVTTQERRWFVVGIALGT